MNTLKQLAYIILTVTTLVLVSCAKNKEDIVVGLQPYGNFKHNHTNEVAAAIKQVYGFKVVLLESKIIPKETFINVKSPRYRADKLIKILKDQKPDSIDYLLGLTNKDISTTKTDALGFTLKPKSKYEDWGIFGLGYMPGKSCIVSTYRYKASQSKLIDRLKKIAVHEIGHNLGLDHCVSEKCVMRDAVESIKSIDNEVLDLCEKCREKI